MFWAWQNKKGKEPSSVTKMGIGCVLCGAAYIIMILAAQTVPVDQRGSLLWLVSTTFIFTMGELYLSPIGLSLVTKVSPKPIVSTMMGMWFLSSFFGNYMTGYIGSFYSRMTNFNFFVLLTAMGIITGFVFIVLRKPVANVIGHDV
jgi:POT family proton-dependent oligopeptide transporter